MEILKLDDLVGNSAIISILKKSVKNRSVSQMLLLSGVHGIGKSSVAELIALSLTCEHPANGEACRTCETCKKTIMALKPGSNGISPRVEKINMALVAENKTMKDFLVSTFQVVRSDGIYVKILEEFHQLPKEDQGLMLEETARLPNNVYLILTTTHISRVLKEIDSRCLTLNFGRLNRSETTVLVDKVNQRLKLKAEDYNLIFQKTGGIPRNITVLVKFLSDNNPTSEELDALLGNINKEIFIDVLHNINNFRMYLAVIDNLMAAYPADLILDKLHNFLMQIVFALEGDIYEYIPKKLIATLPFKDADTVYKVIKLLETTTPKEHSLKVFFLKLRRLLAPAMLLHEQKSIADMNSNVKGISVAETEHKLARFNRN